MKNNLLMLLAGLSAIQPQAEKKQVNLDWKNYSPNNSAMGFDADTMNFLNYMGFDGNRGGKSALGYDSDFRTFNPFEVANSMDQKQLRSWLQAQVASGAMTTSRLKIVYTAVNVSPAPVDITVFNSTFQEGGVFNADGDLVFTNAGGDTATISCTTKNGPNGRTVTLEQLYKMTETQPFTIGFMRMVVQTQSQFTEDIGIVKDGQFGGYGGNSITPDDYVDPNQYQFLRVDVPMNVDASQQNGFTWTINEDQSSPGIAITLFITKTLNPNKQLGGQAPVRVLNEGMTNTFFTPSVPTGEVLSNIAQNPMIKNIISSGVQQDMGQNLIRTILNNPNISEASINPIKRLG